MLYVVGQGRRADGRRFRAPHPIERVGHRDLDRLSVSRAVLAETREEFRSRLHPPKLARLCPSASATQIRFEPPCGRLPTNPSVCLHKGELWCVVRAVNYSLFPGRNYVIHDPRGVVRTENYLGRLRPDGELVGAKPMRDLDPMPRQKTNIVGYEDVRIVSVGGRLTGSATVCDRFPDERRRVARLHLDAQGNVKQADVQPSNQLHEKNWMPLSVGGKFTWIYSVDPTAILPGPLRQCSFALEHLRGGAAIAFKGGYLCVMHEVIDKLEGRVYLHRFVRMDERFNVTTVSPAWVFAHDGIEFCCGLARDKSRLVMSYGVEDREAWTMRVEVKEIENMKWITP